MCIDSYIYVYTYIHINIDISISIDMCIIHMYRYMYMHNTRQYTAYCPTFLFFCATHRSLFSGNGHDRCEKSTASHRQLPYLGDGTMECDFWGDDYSMVLPHPWVLSRNTFSCIWSPTCCLFSLMTCSIVTTSRSTR